MKEFALIALTMMLMSSTFAASTSQEESLARIKSAIKNTQSSSSATDHSLHMVYGGEDIGISRRPSATPLIATA